MKKTKLKNAPLKEVVFELTWELQNEDINVIDSGFQLAQGKFQERISKEYRILKTVGTYKPRLRRPVYQFWKDELRWPVIHFGPGILAVSDTEQEYEWETTLAPAISFAIKCLIESYEMVLNFKQVRLRYVDAIDLNNTDDLSWISKNLLTTLHTQYDLPGERKAFRIDQTFVTEEGSEILLSIENALNNTTSKRAIIWTTTIQKNDISDIEKVAEWINYAHQKCSDTFIKNLNPQFYESLD